MVRPSAVAIALGLTFLGLAVTAAEPDSRRAAKPLPDRLENELRLHFYNIGAGTCILVECPGADARPIIVDCGKLHDGQSLHAISDRDLKARIHDVIGARSPDDDVLSHGDSDHVSLIPDVLDQVRVSAIWQGDDPRDYPDAVQRWVSRQQEQGAAIHRQFRPDWHNDAQLQRRHQVWPSWLRREGHTRRCPRCGARAQHHLRQFER